MAIPNYKLSTILCGHSLDVRCVSVTKDECILSASRDKTAKLWHPEGVKEFSNVVTYKGHSNFVSSVCFLPPCEVYPEGLVITGSNDTTICAYNIQDPDAILTFKGHENVVCNVSKASKSGTFLSASWDNTGKLWSVNSVSAPLLTLKGHTAAVWAIIELGNSFLATASADKSIILWNSKGEKTKTLTGHTDCVRALAAASNDSFLSCGNDASIRLWSNNGDCLNTFFGHTNYIYSISMMPRIGPMSFITCGEDSTVRVWSAGDNVCTITLPAQSVWSNTCLSNGDIVAGSSDGVVRVFSCDAIRYADDVTLSRFEEEVMKLQEASQQEIGGIKITDLPGPEILFEPGKSDGQTKLVRSGANVKCYSWSATTQSWTEIGDVMGSKGASEGKTLFEGKEYDFVFSVDIEDGKPPIKLPYNIGEDPWVSAQAFIHKNFLPQVYLEQVANFIITNSGQNGNVTSNNGDFMDPFTGGSRYVPGTAQPLGQKAGQNADPFTGSSSYSSDQASNAAFVKETGNVTKYFPQKSYLKFEQGNLTLILEKLKEFNNKMTSDQVISDNDLQSVVILGDPNSSYSIENVTKLKKLLLWPQEILFPVLDVTRLALRNEKINADLFQSDGFGEDLLRILLTNVLPGCPPANQLLSLRVMTNAFTHLPGEMMILKNHESVINSLICLMDLNKNMQIASATLLLNLCVALGNQPDTTLLCDCALQMLTRFSDNEGCFRCLVALGTLIAESPNKVPIVSKIVSNSSFMKKSGEYTSYADPDPTKMKVSLCFQQMLNYLRTI